MIPIGDIAPGHEFQWGHTNLVRLITDLAISRSQGRIKLILWVDGIRGGSMELVLLIGGLLIAGGYFFHAFRYY